MTESKNVIRCINSGVHRRGEGNILAIVSDNCIFAQCRDRGCRRWTRIAFNLPGINLDLGKAGITAKIMPQNYHFDLEKAAVVVENES